MSFGSGYNGGRTRFQTKVFLNVYDLAPANDYLYPIGLGLHHSGVEIMGTEYSFASGAGVFESPPKVAPGARFREQLELGAYDGGSAELKKVIAELRDDFGPDQYNIIRRNCNHFANALSWKLLGRKIPAHVNRLAELGMCCSCLLPRHMLENAPVGGTSPPSESSFMMNRGTSSAQKSTPAFTGSGARLGSSSSSSNGTLPEDLTDRRERARKAALARFERNQQQAPDS